MKKYQSIVRPYTCAMLIDEFYTCFYETFKDEEFSFSAGKSKCLDLDELRRLSFDVFSRFVQELAVDYKVHEVLHPNGVSLPLCLYIDLSRICEFYDSKAFLRLGIGRSIRILHDYPAILQVFNSILWKCGLKCFRLMYTAPSIVVSDFVFKYKY